MSDFAQNVPIFVYFFTRALTYIERVHPQSGVLVQQRGSRGMFWGQ